MRSSRAAGLNCEVSAHHSGRRAGSRRLSDLTTEHRELDDAIRRTCADMSYPRGASVDADRICSTAHASLPPRIAHGDMEADK
jgi:hypothetical protein